MFLFAQSRQNALLKIANDGKGAAKHLFALFGDPDKPCAAVVRVGFASDQTAAFEAIKNAACCRAIIGNQSCDRCLINAVVLGKRGQNRELDRGKLQPCRFGFVLEYGQRDLVQAPDQVAGHHINFGHLHLLWHTIVRMKEFDKHTYDKHAYHKSTQGEDRMSTQLGTLEELPQDYRDDMAAAGVAPLWPMMRNVLPHGAPRPVTKPGHWEFAALRPLLMRAGELTPVEKAERRVLVLSDPGRGTGAMQATSSIYLGMQLLLPGETAPAHVHTPSAVRIIVEGKGGYTVVDGEKLPMEEGDLVLTPGGEWHDHGHEGTEPVIWLDALDLPLFVYLEGSYAEEGPLQAQRNRPDASQVEYLASGLAPSRKHGVGARRYPMMRYPWTRTKEALRELVKYNGVDVAELDYVNPETGADVLPTMGFTAMMLTKGAKEEPPLRSSSAAFHVIGGKGRTIVNDRVIEWGPKDTFTAPVFAKITHQADEDAYIIRVHDRPLQEKLGYYEERSR